MIGKLLALFDRLAKTVMDKMYPALPITDGKAPPEPVLSPTEVYKWATPKEAKHSTRVICDEEGLSFADKNLICAVIMAESGFYNTAKNVNRKTDGSLGSTDWGICQINDRFHIGAGKTFPSVDYVLHNPDKVVRWMIAMFRVGHLDWWVAYKTNSHKKYL
jgi:hypothetical protein